MASSSGYEILAEADMDPTEVKVSNLPAIEPLKDYKIRWFILTLFVLFSAANSMQWIQYSIIANVITEYYNVSTIWVDWTSIIYMVLYIPFIFPGSYLLDKLGLRIAIILGISGTCIGSWIKVLSIAPDRFYIGFLGQSIVALSQVFVLSVPARLAAVWFGPSQVSSACSIGVFGNQLGIASGFLIPPLLVNSKGTSDEIQHDLFILFLGVAIFTTVLFVAIILFFKNEPPTPPSYAQAQQQNDGQVDFIGSLKSLLVNGPYILLLLAYGINVGIFYAISTLLNQIILQYYKDAEADAGRIGVLIVFAGMLGSVICGVILDKFHRFKETTVAVYAMSLVSMVIFSFALDKGMVHVYIVSGLLGFFMTGLLPVGFELAAELTYPEPEGTSAGLLNAASQVFGTAFTSLYSFIFHNFNDTWANVIMSVMLLIGTILTFCITSDLRRQAAQVNKS
ncbi:uncharacterized MFS-type transporter C09D4.1 [Harmonia axyridis]|uniref:uncharacterized MFS-type transporter C09D4.1 n=1 Tax=Harmonia axyridis TaxID=115357 RepID=UPI001E27704C|nr:uncharacterized MFS-type transporter C09D4.1 [Harmonia axyridis]